MPVRALLFGLPPLLIALTFWAAQQARLNREQRHGDLFALVSDPDLPQVNPYQPNSEAARQLTELIHEPLFKLDAQGKIGPALASEWRWQKRVTVWFETANAAAEAEQRLLALSGSHWPAWSLDHVSRADAELRLIYSDPQASALRETLQAAKARVLPVTILRVTAPAHAQAVQAALLSLPDLARPVQRSWRDEQDAIELALIQMPNNYDLRLREALQRSVRGAEIKIELRAQQPSLEEPLLEITLREALWHDGTQVTATDVKATFDALSQTAWKLPNRAGLDAVHRMEVIAPNRLHLALWRHYGPALCAWVGLPILPASWWQTHPLDAAGHAFLQAPPIGAGACAVVHRGAGVLVLQPTSAQAKATRLSLVANLSGFNAHLGFATDALDLYWPSTHVMPQQQTTAMSQRHSPTRELIQVQWNTRTELFADLRVRQALAASVDRHEMIERALAGQAQAHGGFFAKGLWLSANRPAMAKDAALAERLLAEAGWLRNVQGLATMPDKTLAFQLAVPSSDPALMRVAAELRLQWLALGVQTKLRLLEPAALQRAITTQDFDAVLSRSAPLTTWDLGPPWHSASTANVTGFSNRLLDLLIEALEQDFDPKRAAEHAQQAEAIILDNYAVLPLLLTTETASLRTALAGEEPPAGWTLENLLLR